MIGQLVVVIVVALVIAGMVAPSESLGWWRRSHLGQRGIEWPTVEQAFSSPAHLAEVMPNAERPDRLPPETEHYVVYLSGIGISTPDQLPVMEVPMVDRLRQRMGGTTLVSDIYAYSAENVALTQGRRLSRLWQTLTRWKFEGHRLRGLGFLINLRNAFQVFVSADSRYGPVFNLAIAQQIAGALVRSGYVPEHRKPVTLLGWSGGAQVAAGAAWYLSALGMDVRLLSMAGTLSSDPGLDRCQQIWHLRGRADRVQGISIAFSARRWVFYRNSSWNRAKRDGRLKFIGMGPLTHTGAGSYFAAEPLLPDGREPRQAAADYILGVLVDAGLATDNFAADPALPELGKPEQA
ncbi:MAG: hypothetical protein ACOX61_13025 [Brooklawnia sp.]|jgi:hypothetical protein